MLRIQAARRGRAFVNVARNFPSSQICSACGHRDSPKPLHIRTWTCPHCHTRHDRDWNAGRERPRRRPTYPHGQHDSTTHPRTWGPKPVTARVNACGAPLRPGDALAARTTPIHVGRKQEPARAGGLPLREATVRRRIHGLQADGGGQESPSVTAAQWPPHCA
ncbi:zinc ribbon domain-containing protein [Streptomyces sp. ME19-01-6]|uniref:zinc ribbon domain-containing protein n=1 Tax=Streptomyces sp. ME19-01-6 TaxID=3028686 RepID=UPI0029B027E9|nr:zinc ribbon domain-containing protein [Streptomyces sp. ME19-01-6]MDX3226576.1 zinc ribbon domain-containing protein [Streptomyces sp. ME19-01-6]